MPMLMLTAYTLGADSNIAFTRLPYVTHSVSNALTPTPDFFTWAIPISLSIQTTLNYAAFLVA